MPPTEGALVIGELHQGQAGIGRALGGTVADAEDDRPRLDGGGTERCRSRPLISWSSPCTASSSFLGFVTPPWRVGSAGACAGESGGGASPRSTAATTIPTTRCAPVTGSRP